MEPVAIDEAWRKHDEERRAKHRADLVKHPAEPSLFLDRLVREHAKARPGHIGVSAVTAARMQLQAGNCWPVALGTLRHAYDEETAKEAWWWLMADPDHGWSTWSDRLQRWLPYCVPGYSPLCGDAMDGECVTALLNMPRQGLGRSPWGKSGAIELHGLPDDRFPIKDGDPYDYITTGLVDEGDPKPPGQRQVYRLEPLDCRKAEPGTVIRRIIAPPGSYHLGADRYRSADGGKPQQDYYGSWTFDVEPGQTVVIAPDPGTGQLVVRPATGLVATARRVWPWALGAVGLVGVGVAAAMGVRGRRTNPGGLPDAGDEGAAMDRARLAKRDLLVHLLSIGAEQEFHASVGIGRGNGTQPYSLDVRLDRQTPATGNIPSMWDGLPVHVVVTGPVRAR